MCQAESVASSCECDNTAAIIGGVVAVVFIVTAAVTTVVNPRHACAARVTVVVCE